MIRPGRGPVIALLIAAVSLTACGSSDDDSAVASAGGGGAASASSTPSSNSGTDPLKFAQCLRSHGIDVPDPDPNNGGLQAIVPALRNAPADKRNAAMNACKEYLGGIVAEKQSGEYKAEMVTYINCLQSHGAKVDDPDPSTGRPTARTVNQLENPDPTTKNAMNACADKKPGANAGGQ